MDYKKLLKTLCTIGVCLNISLSAFAETITYKSVLSQAISNSIDLKIANLDIDISKTDLKSAKSELYPILNVQANTEYNNGLGNTRNVGYVGNSIISSYTQFRNMAQVGLQYNLFDFGVRGKRIAIAKSDIEQKQVMLDLQLKDLYLKILDVYTKTLLCSDTIKIKSEILKVYENMFAEKERLYKAGVTDKISLMDEAIKIARTQDDLQNAKLELKNSLSELSSYTFKKYEATNLEVLDFEELNIESGIINVSYPNSLKATIIAEDV